MRPIRSISRTSISIAALPFHIDRFAVFAITSRTIATTLTIMTSIITIPRSLSRKTVGNVRCSISVIRNAVKIISEKIDTEKEIHTMLVSKKLEFEIMCAVPFVIILYMKMTFGDFLEVLYGNTAGMIVMSICLAVYIAAYRLGRYIIRIEV